MIPLHLASTDRLAHLDVDIVAYLADRLPAHFDENYRGILIGSCLFHRDGARPNLAIFPESGGYFCNACGAKGNVVNLVQRIEGFASYSDAEAWLVETYGDGALDDDEDAPIRLILGGKRKPSRPVPRIWTPPDPAILDEFRRRHPYLERDRGVEEAWQRRFGIGYCARRQAITFPWYDRKGALMTVKFRSIRDKAFWYTPMGQGVKKSLLYGIHHVQRRRDKRVAVVEAEIDAITAWQAMGLAAVGAGGAEFSDEQARELALAGVEEVVLMGDNDVAGRRLNDTVRQKMARLGVGALEVAWQHEVKDVNDALLAGRIAEVRVEERRGLALGGRRGVA